MAVLPLPRTPHRSTEPERPWSSLPEDECARVCAVTLAQSGVTVPEDGHLLEIGCAEYNWLKDAQQAWPTVTLTGIDWRPGPQMDGVTTIQGDVLTHDFPAASFDAVVAISTIEHIGLGHYKRDPIDAEGDRRTLQRVWRWLRPGGWLYFDVPWNAGEEAYAVIRTRTRVYDAAQHQVRLRDSAAWEDCWRGYFPRRSAVPLPAVPTQRLQADRKEFYFCACVWRKP